MSLQDSAVEARTCRNDRYDEAGWNILVHDKVLSLALPPSWQSPASLVSFIPCSTASILPEYTETRASRKVDFCLCIEPDKAAAAAIKTALQDDETLGYSINHTDFYPLRTRPIALSIETKVHGEGLATAESQLLTWHLNQWRVLERLVERTTPRQPLPEFLPGVIVQGHDWSLVASTKTDDCVTLWTGQTIGSTTEALGVYQIVCVLQYLARWAEDEYWPWYRRAVLGLANPAPVSPSAV
ncbi:hypothetical protein LZ30DRAFT_787392 [Colletotrichum cereale]|nr:hypothetical protein LZ30DRAFT_787392 [Colletotrichum cereale]